ncbi:FtsX-like permease family protein [Xanthomonas translucens pv. arrhenatheri]|uniref:ABC transporter permease n=1 Tax=Xanthomonas graminis TaxID=3390026 RepID=UPI001E64B46C|nr:FtsX-like permease family protein [Xanthomonas translucens]UKE79587.1 FtsX-like permease family protein [Xanthomonas translucens pv. arrhenatheri]
MRRALGATRRAVFAQCLVEAGLIGLIGGAAGIPLSCLGVMVLRAQPIAYAKQLHVDAAMLAVAVLISIGAALLAGLGPAWRASRIAPVLQMKSL